MRINQPVTQNEVQLADNQLIVSKTDLKGLITYVNKDFIDISGFTEQELIGTPHNIVRHPDMPTEVFADLWQTLQEKRPWTGYVKNRCKNGDHYWVQANTTPVWENGQIAGYMSVRRKADAATVARIDEQYRKFREKRQGSLRIRYGQIGSGEAGIFAGLNLAGRMGAILGGLGLITVAVMAWVLLALSQTNRNVNSLYEERFEPVRIIGGIGRRMAENRGQLLLALQHDPASPFAKMHDHPVSMHTDTVTKNIADITRMWEEYQKTIRDEEHRALAEAYAVARKSFVQDGLLAARELLLREDFAGANLLILQQVNPLYTAAAEKADMLFKFHTELAHRDMAAAQERYTGMLTLLLVAVAALLAIGFFASVRLIAGIRQPIQGAIDTFSNIAQGNYRNLIDITRNDELGKLNQALQSMQTRMGFEMAETKRQADAMTRVKIALDNVSTGVMIANTARTIIYTNKSAQSILKGAEAGIRQQLPNFDADHLVGSNIDSFHKNPAHQARILAELASSITADLRIGNRHMTVTANPVFDDKGERLGSVAEWQDRTAEVAVEQEVEGIIVGAAEGDFTRRLSLEGKSGFIRNLATGLNQLLDTASTGLADVAGILNALAHGDLTQTMSGDYRGTFGQLKDDTNTTVMRLREVVERIKDATEAINTAAKEIAAGNQDLSARTEEQASSLEETASSMEEFNATVRQNADSARKASELAGSSNQIAARSGEKVRQVVETMSGIQTSSKKIADIVGVIDSIAFQTNILALNAAVEAARAGEQGRGFAVVATEVRNLAQRSATAAKEIKLLIGESVDKVESGVHLVHEAGATMDEVVSSFQQVARLVMDISNASREQSSGIDQVTQAVSQMDEVTQQNAALVEQAAAAAESLEEQTMGLVQAVSMFKLREGNTLPAAALRDVTPPRQLGAAGSAPREVGTPSRLPPPYLSGDDEDWKEF